MTSVRRTSRPMNFDRDAVLAKLGEARSVLVEARRSMKPKTGLARAIDGVISEIDEFALVMTGSRDHFHLKPHGTPHPKV